MRLVQSLEMSDNKHPVTVLQPRRAISTALWPENPHFKIMQTLRMSGAVPL